MMLVACMLLSVLQVSAQGEEPKPRTPQGRVFEVKGVKFTMIYVEGGIFQMGNHSGEADENPVHEVKLSSFLIGQTEVTQELWEAVMGSNPSNWKRPKLPVETVSWDDCQTFIRKLNKLTSLRFRLPREAEWEYAARGGNQSEEYAYSGSNDIRDVAWYENGIFYETHAVAMKSPNELGLYDMSGNVWEWCSDWYDYDYYFVSPVKNPSGPYSGTNRVLRGGSWGSAAELCRVTERNFLNPSGTANIIGFRLVL